MGKKSLEVLLVKLYSIVDRDFMGEKESIFILRKWKDSYL